MYTIIKRLEISASHKLTINYKSKCQNLHGHNWIIDVYLGSEKLDENGMVYDFTKIKQEVSEILDHKNINDVIYQPTAENMAKFICDRLGNKCFRVKIKESEWNTAIYEG